MKSQIDAWKVKVEKSQVSSRPATHATGPDVQVPIPANNNPAPPATALDTVEIDEKKDDEIANAGELKMKVSSDPQGLVRFSVSVPDIKEEDCPPVDLVLVMDRSGSMSTAVVGVDEDTQMVVE